MPALEIFFNMFADSLNGHAAFAVYLFVIMDERGQNRLKKLPVLLLSPLAVSLIATAFSAGTPDNSILRYCLYSALILLMCTLWVRWAWHIGFWPAFAAACMAGILQVAVSCLSQILSLRLPISLEHGRHFAVVMIVYFSVVLSTSVLLYRLRFGAWFRLLLEDESNQRRTALLLFALEAAMETFLLLQSGIRSDYLVQYYFLTMIMAVLMAGLVVHLAQRFDAARKLEAQQDTIARQQLYEQDLESIRQEVRRFRHDYKNLLSGLSEAAAGGELDQLRTSLSELDTDFDRRIGEKIQVSVQIGNLLIPQVRSLLLSKLAAMGVKGIDCRMEVLYPVKKVGIDVWDFVRCLGILLDNAAEGALETETPWVEILLLAREEELSLRVSNPYTGTIEPDKIWEESFSTKGAGRGLGLPNYQRILSEYPNTASSTSWAGGVFVQELTIGGAL